MTYSKFSLEQNWSGAGASKI